MKLLKQPDDLNARFVRCEIIDQKLTQSQSPGIMGDHVPAPIGAERSAKVGTDFL